MGRKTRYNELNLKERKLEQEKRYSITKPYGRK